MSRFAAWDAATWVWASFWSLNVVAGLVAFLAFLRRREKSAGDSTPKRRRESPAWVGPMLIGVGLVQLLTLRPDASRASFDIAVGIFIAAFGLWVLLFHSRFAAASQRRHQARLADRLARGEDAYFEELRELEAYPPRIGPPALWQYALGALYLIVGGALIAVNLSR